MARIVDAHAHADDQVGPFAIREYEPRRELGAPGDVLDGAGQRSRQGVDRDLGLFADADAGDVGLGDEHLGVGMVDVGDGDHRRAGGDDLTRIDGDLEDGAGGHGVELMLAEALASGIDLSLGGASPGGGGGHFLASRTVAEGPKSGLAGAALGDGGAVAGREIIDRGLGGGILREQPLLARKVGLEAILGGAGGLDLGGGGADILGARAGADQLGVGAGGGRFTGAHRLGGLCEGVIENRENLACGDGVALGHRHLLDPAADLKPEIALVEFDDALIGAGVGIGRAARHHPGEDRANGEHKRPLMVFYHTTEKYTD